MSDRLTVTSKWRNYAVDFVDDALLPLGEAARERSVVVCDAVVYERYRHRLDPILPQDGVLIVEANEHNKTLTKCHEILEELVERQVRRNHRLIAVGGGIIQDVTAFVASVLYRGIEWLFVPTTLLAQADSCIGGKTSINLADKKNLVGNFYPPSEIFLDTAFLQSLDEADIKSGIGEMLHFYLYADSPLTAKLIANHAAVIANRALLGEYIRESLAIKKRVIETDEFDNGERQKLNYGHTFGHALESATDYAVKHGQAVTVGMDLANWLSVEEGLMRQATFERLHGLLAVNFPAWELVKCDWDRYFVALSRDKKNIGKDLVCVLAEGPGRLVMCRLVLDHELKARIRSYFSDIFAPASTTAAARLTGGPCADAD